MNLRISTLAFACLVGTSSLAQDEPRTKSDREVENLKPKSQTQPSGKDANKRADANDTWGEWFADLLDREDSSSDGQEKKGGSKKQPSGNQNSIGRFMARYDADSNGTVSREELPNGMRQGFAQIDRDNDGQLTADEIQQHARRHRLVQSPVVVTYVWLLDTHEGRTKLEDLQEAYSTLKQIDEDSDGKITRTELKERRKEIATRMIDRCFENHDDNDDDQLTRAEARGTVIASHFRKYDENRDGKVGKQEVKEAIEQMPEEGHREATSREGSEAR